MMGKPTCLPTRGLVDKLQPRALAQVRAAGHYEGVAAPRVQDHVDILAGGADRDAGVVSAGGNVVDQRLGKRGPLGQARVPSRDNGARGIPGDRYPEHAC